MNSFIIFIFLIICSILWAFHVIINRMIFNDTNPIHFFIITSVILGLICLPFLFFIDLDLIKNQSKYVIIYPVIGIFANILFFYCVGYSKNHVASVVCIQNTLLVLFVCALGYYLLEEQLNNKKILGIFCGLITVYLLSE